MIAQVGRHLQRLGQRLAAIAIVLTEQDHRFMQMPVHQAIANIALAKIGLIKPFQFGTFLEIRLFWVPDIHGTKTVIGRPKK